MLLTKLLFGFGIATNHFELESIPTMRSSYDVISGYSMLNIDFSNELYGEVYFSNAKQRVTQTSNLIYARQVQQSLYSKKI